MPAYPRSEIFNPDQVGVYHCFAQCVRRAYLFGWDRYTGKDCSYRKLWVRDLLQDLAGAMAIDVLDYAVLDDHLHTVLRNRPDVAAAWSDAEVVRRWQRLCPERKEPDGSPAELSPWELRLALADPERVAELRLRLSDISWFMRLLTQPVAKRANREDKEKGRFFGQRFGSEPIESLAQLLTCSIYVDLNLIRAGVALTPETSEFTSAYDRIAARLRRQRESAVYGEPAAGGTYTGGEAAEDAWLAPIFLDERAEAYEDPAQAAAANHLPAVDAVDVAAPARASNKGFLPLTNDEYLRLLDWAGRQLRRDKRGAIPAELAPLLERLGIDGELWTEWLQSYEPRTRPNAAHCRQRRPRRGCHPAAAACQRGQPARHGPTAPPAASRAEAVRAEAVGG